MLFDFSPVKRQEKTNSFKLLGKRTLYSVKHRGKERVTLTPSKREARSAKFEVSKVLFPDIGKITNTAIPDCPGKELAKMDICTNVNLC